MKRHCYFLTAQFRHAVDLGLECRQYSTLQQGSCVIAKPDKQHCIKMDEREILDPARLRGVVDDLDFYITLFHNQAERIPNGGVANKNIVDAQQCAKILKKHRGLLRCVNDSVYEDMCIPEQMTSQKGDCSDSVDETDSVAPKLCSDGNTFSAAATALAIAADFGIVLYCMVLYCIALRCVALLCFALRCVALHCIILISLHCDI